MKTPENGTTSLVAALVAAQHEMPTPRLDKTNPHFGSKYTSLAELVRTVKPVLAKHGITWRWVDNPVEGGIHVSVELIHESGETLSSGGVVIKVPTGNPQHIKSAHTYARRFTLESAVAVAGNDDDDAEGTWRSISEEQAATLEALIEEVEADKAKFLKWLGVSNIREIPEADYRRAVKVLEAKR